MVSQLICLHSFEPIMALFQTWQNIQTSWQLLLRSSTRQNWEYFQAGNTASLSLLLSLRFLCVCPCAAASQILDSCYLGCCANCLELRRTPQFQFAGLLTGISQIGEYSLANRSPVLSRLLCKLPGTEEDPNSREVPWHQDSQYWPLTPMKVRTDKLRTDKLITDKLRTDNLRTTK